MLWLTAVSNLSFRTGNEPALLESPPRSQALFGFRALLHTTGLSLLGGDSKKSCDFVRLQTARMAKVLVQQHPGLFSAFIGTTIGPKAPQRNSEMLGSSPLLSGRMFLLLSALMCLKKKKKNTESVERDCRSVEWDCREGHRSREAEGRLAQLPKSAARVSKTLFSNAQAQAELGGRGRRGGIARQGEGVRGRWIKISRRLGAKG